MRFKGGNTSSGIEFRNGFSFLSVLDRIGLTEEVEHYLPIHESATAMVERCLDMAWLALSCRNFSLRTNLQPVILGIEDGLDDLGDINVNNAGSDAHDWSIFFVQFFKDEM